MSELEKLQKENKILRADLEKVTEIKNRFAQCFLEITDGCIDEVMHDIFENSNYDSDEFENFCNEKCPFERCEWDCFSKERDDRCDNRRCNCCPDQNDCDVDDNWHPSLSDSARNR